MNLKVGIVGLPNAGKSTLFNALLKKQQAFVANYPFATIDPNVGVVPIPDERLNKLAEIVEATEKKKPPIVCATIEFVDIAGLVKGAAQGQGLGNKFLSHIREVQLICHVVRLFNDPDVIHIEGEVDPLRDRDIVETELLLADLATLEKQQEPKGIKDRDLTKRWELIVRLKEGLNKGTGAREIVNEAKDLELLKDLHLLTFKPILYILNVSESQVTDIQTATLAKQYFPHSLVICAKTESELSSLAQEDQNSYLKELGLEFSGLDRLAKKAYEMLGLISFLTSGIKEVRAWTIKKGTCAREASGVIHTDFVKNFIKADVIQFNLFVESRGWTKARELGRVRSEGKDYEIKDGDVVEFKIGI